MTVAKLPPAGAVDGLDFGLAAVDKILTKRLVPGDALDWRRTAVLVCRTEPGKPHLAVDLSRAWARDCLRIRFLNVVDLADRPDAETIGGWPMRLPTSTFGYGLLLAECRFAVISQCAIKLGLPDSIPHFVRMLHRRLQGDRLPILGRDS